MAQQHLSSATASVFLEYLEKKHQSLGPCLFSTAQADELKNYRAKITGKGVTLTVLECTVNGVSTVLAGMASAHLEPSGDIFLRDSSAVLFDERQAHLPNLPAQWSVRFLLDYGPTWGHNCLRAFQISQAASATLGCEAVAHPDYPTWSAKPGIVAKVVHIYQVLDVPFKMNADFGHLTRTDFATEVSTELRDLSSTTIGVCAVAGSGKSTLLNSFVSMIKKRTVTSAFNAGGGAGTAGQRTVAAQRCALFSQGGRPHPNNKELFLRDTVGTEQIDVLMHHLKGILKPGEKYNRTDAAAYAQRSVSSMDAAHVILLLIPEDVLSGPQVDDVTVQFFERLRELTSQYDCNRAGKEFQLTVIPVITKVDVYCAHPSRRITDRSCLLARSQGPLKELFLKLKEAPFHFQPRNAFAIGWLEDDVFSYADDTEPVVLALKQILCVAVETGAGFIRMNGLA